MSFTIAAGPRLYSHSRVRVPHHIATDGQSISNSGTRDHILLSQIWNFPFVASHDSQGHGGGIRPRLHTVVW
jgi:hypothetical protein